MRTLDRIFAALFAIEGVAALIGVLFKGATWHIVTVILCAVLVVAFLADAEDNDNEKDEEGYDKVNDHHPYPQEMEGDWK